jgi:hypothetical protein
MQMQRIAWLIPALAVACGGPIDHKQVASQAREGASIAAQGAFLADRAAAGALTDAYRRGHAEKLRDQLAQCEKQLAKPALEPVAEREAGLVRAALPLVDAQLKAIEAGSLDGRAAHLRRLAGELRVIRQRIQ